MAVGTAVVLATLVVEAALVASYPPSADQNQHALRAALAMIYLYIVSLQLIIQVSISANVMVGFRGVAP
jgi:hypothetical protein